MFFVLFCASMILMNNKKISLMCLGESSARRLTCFANLLMIIQYKEKHKTSPSSCGEGAYQSFLMERHGRQNLRQLVEMLIFHIYNNNSNNNNNMHLVNF